MSMSSTDKGLLTPDNCAVIFIDYQPQLFLGGTDVEWAELLKNGLLLAKAAKMFAVPVILTSVESGDFDGAIAPQLHALFPDQPVIQRSSMNAWDDPGFVARSGKPGARNFVLAGLWSEACLTFPALQMLEEGYGVYAVKDASRGTNPAAQDTALRRVEQAGGVSVTALQVLLEFQRDWGRRTLRGGQGNREGALSGYHGSAERQASMAHNAPGGSKPNAGRQDIKTKSVRTQRQ